MTSDRRTRSRWIASAAAVVVGSTTGGALALHRELARLPASSPASDPPAPASTPPGAMRSAPPGPPPGAAAPAAAGPASPSPDARAVAAAQIKVAVMRFVLWSREHPDARCPDAAALGAVADPWGRPPRILCTDQPDDQVVGVLSLGPDGLPGTPDDIASWMLGPEVTDVVRGAPWGSSRSASASVGTKRLLVPAPHRAGPRMSSATSAPPSAATSHAAPPRTKPSVSAGAGAKDTDGDGIPDRR
jgi:hypothetical protein